ncbi:RNA-dependent RNA polymerase 1-like, partial [Morus notabilis]|uniref:RNA-dependent RNA polymerase 1-like n=1 Tax=Morus notabilis TaxID=981085 RepID=UPI000CECFEC9
VIGKLFRQVKDVEEYSSSIKSFTKEVASECYDPDMEVEGFEDFVEEAFELKSNYDNKLGNLMDYYGIKTEAELLSGNVLTKSRHFDKKRDLESANYAVKALIKEARTWFNNQGDEAANGGDDAYAKKASAWYHVTYHPHYWGRYNKDMGRDHFLSFAWCVYDKLVMIKRDNASMKRSVHMSSLVKDFSS